MVKKMAIEAGTLIKRYLPPKPFGNEVTITGDEAGLATIAPFLIKANKGTVCQVMKAGYFSKVMLDLDDRADTLEEAETQTAEMVEWSKTKLADSLAVDPKELAISQSPGEEWVRCSKKGEDGKLILERNDKGEIVMEMKKGEVVMKKDKNGEMVPVPLVMERWERSGLFKASVHVVVKTMKIEWTDTYKFLEHRGVIAHSPQHIEKDKKGKSKGSVIDAGLYAKSKNIRLINNSKPGPQKPEDCWDPDELPPGGEAKFDGTDGRVKTAVTWAADNGKQNVHHVLTTNLGADGVKVVSSPNPGTPKKKKQSRKSMTPDEKAQDDAQSQQVYSELFDEQDVAYMLFHIKPIGEPPNAHERNLWLTVGAFLKNSCAGLIEDPLRLFTLWSMNWDEELADEHLAEMEEEWDKLPDWDKPFGILKHYAENTGTWLDTPKRALEFAEFATKKDCIYLFLKHSDPHRVQSKDWSKLMELLLPPFLTDGGRGDRKNYFMNEKTGIWKEHGNSSKTMLAKAEARLRKIARKVARHFTAETQRHKKMLSSNADERNLAAAEKKDILKNDADLARLSSTAFTWQEDVDRLGDDVLGNKIRTSFMVNHTIDNPDDNWNPRLKLLTLLPFSNGVYDLRTGGPLRPATRDEHVLYTTGYDFKTRDETYEATNGEIRRYEQEMEMVIKFFKSICREGNQYRYKMVKWAASLLGYNRWEEMSVLTGKGSNGKSSEVSLIRNIFGEAKGLVGEIDPAFFQTKVVNTGAATPELAALRNRRIVFTGEPNDDRPIQCDTFKKITGKDMVSSRGLFESQAAWQPGFDIVMHCNEVPTLSKPDPAVMRRLSMQKYDFTFKKNVRGQESMGIFREPVINSHALDHAVKSEIWRYAGLHVLLDVFKENQTDIISKNELVIHRDIVDLSQSRARTDSSLSLSYHPEEWKDLMTEYGQKSEKFYEFIKSEIVFSHVKAFIDHKDKEISEDFQKPGSTPKDFKKMATKGMKDRIGRGTVYVNPNGTGYKQWAERHGHKIKPGMDYELHKALQLNGAGYTASALEGQHYTGVDWVDKDEKKETGPEDFAAAGTDEEDEDTDESDTDEADEDTDEEEEKPSKLLSSSDEEEEVTQLKAKLAKALKKKKQKADLKAQLAKAEEESEEEEESELKAQLAISKPKSKGKKSPQAVSNVAAAGGLFNQFVSDNSAPGQSQSSQESVVTTEESQESEEPQQSQEPDAKEIEFEGVQYFKEIKTGMVISTDTMDDLGLWDDENEVIKFLDDEAELHHDENVKKKKKEKLALQQAKKKKKERVKKLEKMEPEPEM